MILVVGFMITPVFALSESELSTKVHATYDINGHQLKVPTKYLNLFDQTDNIKKITKQIQDIESLSHKIGEVYVDIEDALKGRVKLDESISDDDIMSWADQYDELNKWIKKNKKNLNPEELLNMVDLYGDATVKLSQVLKAFPNKEPELELDNFSQAIDSDFQTIISVIDTYSDTLEQKKATLNATLSQLMSDQKKYVAKNDMVSKTRQSAENLGTAKVDVLPSANSSEWITRLNTIIGDISPKLNPVKLRPTFSNNSKDLAKETNGSLAKINHIIDVDLKIDDNLANFEKRIKEIDQSIKTARNKLKESTTFKINFEYEEGGKFKDVAYKIIDKFKKIDANFYIANDKEFLQNVAGIREKAKKELENIPIDFKINNYDETSSKIDALISEIDKKIKNIDINLNIKNLPQFTAQVNSVQNNINSQYNNQSNKQTSVTTDTNAATQTLMATSKAAKDAMEGISKILLKEVKSDNIGVCNVYPGGTDTNFRAVANHNYLKPETVAKMIRNCIYS